VYSLTPRPTDEGGERQGRECPRELGEWKGERDDGEKGVEQEGLRQGKRKMRKRMVRQSCFEINGCDTAAAGKL
jgi:hypothetical protein